MRALGAPVAFIAVQIEPDRYFPSLRTFVSSRPPQTTKCDPSQTPKAFERATGPVLKVAHVSEPVAYEKTLSWRLLPLDNPPCTYSVEPSKAIAGPSSGPGSPAVLEVVQFVRS